jgi:hypothetical protein
MLPSYWQTPEGFANAAFHKSPFRLRDEAMRAELEQARRSWWRRLWEVEQ